MISLKSESFFTNSVTAKADCRLKQGGIRESKGTRLSTFGAREVLEWSKLAYQSAIRTELACATSQTKRVTSFFEKNLHRKYLQQSKNVTKLQMTVTWTSGYNIKEAVPFVEWGEKGGRRFLSPAGTLTFDRNSMCGTSYATSTLFFSKMNISLLILRFLQCR